MSQRYWQIGLQISALSACWAYPRISRQNAISRGIGLLLLLSGSLAAHGQALLGGSLETTHPTTADEPAAIDDCQAGMVLGSGGSCIYPGTDAQLSVRADGLARFLFGTFGESVKVSGNFNGTDYDLAASRQGNGEWRVDRVAGLGLTSSVSIPDPNLRQALESILGKTSGETITVSDMQGLTSLTWPTSLRSRGIRDLTGLEHATNVTYLDLSANAVSDLAPIADLTKLIYLALGGNPLSDISHLSRLTDLRSLGLSWTGIADVSPLFTLNLYSLDFAGNGISDISALSRLANLQYLYLWNNNIVDVAPLAGLVLLRYLRLNNNSIVDVEALSGLTRLSSLILSDNYIADISPLTGLDSLEELNIRVNPLSDESVRDHVASLQSRGVALFHDRFQESDFDIDLVFLNPVTERQERVIRAAARRWTSVITADVPDYVIQQDQEVRTCEAQTVQISEGEQIDDIRIHVSVLEQHLGGSGWGGTDLTRPDSHLPAVGCIGLWAPTMDVRTVMHEIGHALGFTSQVWNEIGLFQDDEQDPHFTGPLAIAAFDEAGGAGYRAAKVPTQKGGGSHWRSPMLSGEIMLSARGSALSAITVQSMADMGYGVDVAFADPYTLPDNINSIATDAPDPIAEGALDPDLVTWPSQGESTESAFTSWRHR